MADLPTELPPRDTPILIAGFGSVGRRHFRNLKQLGYHQFEFLRTGRSTLDDSEIAGYASHTNLADALRSRPRIVVVANPSSQHVETALAAAATGCDMLIEKPVATTTAECAPLIEVVRERKLVAMVGCQFRFHPLLAELQQGLAARRIGEVFSASAEWGEYLPDWHPWEDHRQSYSARRDLGGGVALTLIHPFDYLYWLFGPVRNVRGTSRAVASLETPAGEDLVEAVMEHTGGVVSRVHLDYVQKPPVHTLSALGDTGRARIDFHAGSLDWTDTSGHVDAYRVPANFDRNDLFLAEMTHFLQCCQQRTLPRISIEDGCAVVDIARRASGHID